MALKVLTHPGGRTFKMGRKRPVARCPRMSLRNYMLRSLPTAPPTKDYSAAALPELSQILMNDSLGDCTAAGAFHIEGLLLGNAGAGVTWADTQVQTFYSATTGYVPGKESTDQGGDEQTVLNYWQQHGLLADGTHKIEGWVSVDGANQEEMASALWLFENLYFGVELPDAWVNPMPSAQGFTWDVAGDADPDNGHCFVGIGYDEDGVIIDTWGMLGHITWAAVKKYATTAGQGELYAVLGQDAIIAATQKAPSGFDFTQLLADMDSMRG